MKKISLFLSLAISLVFSLPIFANSYLAMKGLHFPVKTVYIGINVGGGSTEWHYLVDPTGGTSVTTPNKVTEGGPSWGAVLGYDVSKNFAVELQYMQFADAHIYFPLYTVYPVTEMVSKTYAYSLSGKFFAQIANTRLRAFAAVGAGLVHRSDPLINRPNNGASNNCITPYMSAGLNYMASVHWLLETGFQYYTGFGASRTRPANFFIPFAWDAYFRLAYQF